MWFYDGMGTDALASIMFFLMEMKTHCDVER